MRRTKNINGAVIKKLTPSARKKHVTLTRSECRTVKMSPSLVVDYIDKEAHKRLGMSARVMLRKYRQGKLIDVGRVADLIVWSDALPEDDPIFEARKHPSA